MSSSTSPQNVLAALASGTSTGSELEVPCAFKSLSRTLRKALDKEINQRANKTNTNAPAQLFSVTASSLADGGERYIELVSELASRALKENLML